MKDKELYEVLLGLKKPWGVEEVKVDPVEKKIEVVVKYEEGTLWGDEEGRRLPTHDHVERRWRHLDSCGFETIIRCRVPRVQGPEGKVWTVPVPWSQPGSRYTVGFESFVIAVLLATKGVAATGELLGLGWDAVHGIMARAVERGLKKRDLEGLRYLGLDEKSFKHDSAFVAVMCDLKKGRALEVMEGKDALTGTMLLETLPVEALDKIEAVSMDMSLSFEAAVEAILPGVPIVHDRYHISANLNEAVDQVRRSENKTMMEEGEEALKGTRQLWLSNPRNHSKEEQASFAKLQKQQLKVNRAWGIKELFVSFWSCADEQSGRAFFKKWYGWAIRSRLSPIKRVARTLKARFENIVSYFRHRITNATAEGLNSKIQSLKSAARGFRNFFNYRTRILFFCGKLDLGT
jgi:transposase